MKSIENSPPLPERLFSKIENEEDYKRKKQIQREEMDRAMQGLHNDEESQILVVAQETLKKSGINNPSKEQLQKIIDTLRAETFNESGISNKSLSFGKKREVVLRAELRRATEKLKNQLTIDKLTGLLNKHGLEHAFNNELERYQKYNNKENIVTIFFDIDGLKDLNDTFTHEVGDVAIMEIAEAIKNMPKREKNDYMAHISGDEFVLLFTDVGREAVEDLVKKVFEAFKNLTLKFTYNGEDKEIPLTVSMGATYSAGRINISLEDMSQEADEAMLLVKRGGRNSYRIFNPEVPIVRSKILTEDEFVEGYLNNERRKLNRIKNPERRELLRQNALESARIAYIDYVEESKNNH